LVTQDEDNEDKSTRQKSNSNTDPTKTLVTQDEDKEDKSTRQKRNSNTDLTKNLGYTGRRQRRQKHKTEK
jgi:hypothetical protein